MKTIGSLIIIEPMRRLLIFIAVLGLTSLSCQAVMGGLSTIQESSGVPATRFLEQSTSTATTDSVSPTFSQDVDASTASPDPTVSPTASSTVEVIPGAGSAERSAPTADSSLAAGFEVRYHPDGPLFQGDRVSLEVIPVKETSLHILKDSRLKVSLQATGQILGEAPFERFGIGGRQQATFRWIWDTSGLAPGEQQLVFTFDTTDDSELPAVWTETVILLPSYLVPAPEPQARWEMVTSECCYYHYITGSEAARDLEALVELTEQEAQDVRMQLKTDFTEKVSITFLPRVLGHGGFAGEEISISYLDRNYAGGSLEQVLHHEMVHILDSRLGGEFRPSLFIEGFAVYLSDGHFKEEPLIERAAALLPPDQGCVQARDVLAGQLVSSSDAPVCRLNRYLPLRQLIDNFYFSQHEIGYLQAGALVEFMVERWGWEAFDAFYRDIQPIQDEEGVSQSGRPSEAVDRALQAHFNLTLQELEEVFKDRLGEIAVTASWVEDVRLVVAFYDAVRRYQQLLDPSAYFLYAWLPGNQDMRDAGIVADYLRRPFYPQNVTIEGLLVRADQLLQEGQYLEVQRMLDTVIQQLDLISPQKAAE